MADEAAEAASSGPARDLPFTRDLKVRWAKGKLSSKDVQELAASASGQGAHSLESVSGIGTMGKHAQNLFRDLCKVFGEPEGSPGLDWIEIPLKGNRKAPHPVFWPHKFMQSLANKRGDIFRKRVLGLDGAAGQFWDSIQHSDFVSKHPFLPRDAWNKIIPIGFHGDGGGFNKQDSLYTLSWNSLLCSGATLQTKFLFTVVRKTDMVADTMDKLIEAFAWSMNVCLSGQTPLQSWQQHPLEGGGQDLAFGYRFALAQLRGDWEWYTQLFYFPQWNAAERMCPFCRASATNRAHSWTDFGPDAWWRDTVWEHEDYIAYLRATGRALPVMFRPGVGVIGLRLSCVTVDILHTIDQGVGSHIIGNTIWYYAVLMAVFGGATYAERIKLCHEDIKRYYKRNRTEHRLRGALTPERVRTSGDWPKLKSKAASTRALAGYALDLALRFANVTSLDEWTRTHDEMSIAVCQLLVEFYTIIGFESQMLSAAAKIRIPELANQLAAIYSKLSVMSYDRRLRMWKLSPKLHLFLHLCLHQAPVIGNPKFWWTYGDEDLVGQMIDIAEGVHPATLAVSVLSKWLWCIFDQIVYDFDSEE
jgi:hypothetical protein